MVSSADIEFVFCLTEDMVADLHLTKMLSGAPFVRLFARFLFLGSYSF
jgi:hypothetical protein